MSVSIGTLPASASGTADLIAKLDQIFDCLNSSTLKAGKFLRRPITSNSQHVQFMKKMLTFIASIKVINPENKKDATNTLKCLRGLRVTLQGTLELWQQLQRRPEVKFLYTCRLNQDPLENFFGTITIRQQGGNSDNPTPIQFCRAFRKLFYDNIAEQSLGNFVGDLDTILVSHPDKKLATVKEESSEPFEVEDSDYRLHEIENNLTCMNAITYVAGYLLKKCLEKHKCKICAEHLVNPELDSSTKLFCYFKAYQSKTKPFSGLLIPSEDFVHYITLLESTFVDELPIVLNKAGLGKCLVGKLIEFSVPQCSRFPGDYVLKLFIRMRLYYVLKFANRDFTSRGRKNRMYFKITHL